MTLRDAKISGVAAWLYDVGEQARVRKWSR